jgi:hypothetical protein
MKISKLLLIILFSLIVLAVAGAVVYKKILNNKENAIDVQTITPSDPGFDPALLKWEQALSSAPWEGRDSFGAVVYKNKIWVMGGVDATKRVISPGNIDYGNSPHLSDVWSSEDGINWQLVLERAPWGERRSMQVAVFKNKMWLMGGWGPEIGTRNDVWSSEDGINWKIETDSAAWTAREGHQLVVFQNKMWLSGGVKYTGHQLFNDVWYSDDGVNWAKATKNAGWSPRWDFSSAVFNNKLWIIGGMDFDDNVYKDVWSSEDGITWDLVNKNPPFAPREGFTMLDYQNKLWVVSVLDIPKYGSSVNDVWYSADGANWKKTEKDPLWNGKEDAGVVIFKNKIWVMGGMDKNWKWTNDVWYSTSNIDTKN